MKYLETTREGRILILTLNNPPHNYLPSAFFRELHLCRDLLAAPEVKAVVVTGKGNVFSKGADLSEIRTNAQAIDRETILYGNDIFSFLSRLTKPVIAAINGPCLGGGLELALSCHLRFCSEKARLGLPEVSAGIIPGLGGIQRLCRVVGEAKALEMILLGDIISAQHALEINLVGRVLPKNDFLVKVLVIVKTILSAPQDAISEVLDIVGRSRQEQEERNIVETAERFARLVAKRSAAREMGTDLFLVVKNKSVPIS